MKSRVFSDQSNGFSRVPQGEKFCRQFRIDTVLCLWFFDLV